MEDWIKAFLSSLAKGDLQVHGNLAVVPLFCSTEERALYVTLKEGLESGKVTVTEVSAGGSVPELKVTNKGDAAVLMLDGEELSGAKQNRVLNTTILVGAFTEITVPVSCTEQGRWSYRTESFADSDVVMAAKARRTKMETVTMNLKMDMNYRSDQGRVWESISELHRDASVSSPTGAMKDVFEAKMKDLEDYVKAVPLVPGQKGLLVFINGRVVGFDFVSRAGAYTRVHGKLVKSYAMEAILEQGKQASEADIMRMEEFLSGAGRAEEKVYKSVGLGWDHRFEASGKVGSSLVHDDEVIHMAFFSATESDQAGTMSGFRQRRAYRL